MVQHFFLDFHTPQSIRINYFSFSLVWGLALKWDVWEWDRVEGIWTRRWKWERKVGSTKEKSERNVHCTLLSSVCNSFQCDWWLIIIYLIYPSTCWSSYKRQAKEVSECWCINVTTHHLRVSSETFLYPPTYYQKSLKLYFVGDV